MFRPFKLLLSVALVAGVMPACQEQKPKKKPPAADPVVPAATTTPPPPAADATPITQTPTPTSPCSTTPALATASTVDPYNTAGTTVDPYGTAGVAGTNGTIDPYADDPYSTSGFGLQAVGLTYSLNIAPIITSKCVKCHYVGGMSVDLSSYAAVRLQTAMIRSNVLEGSMPPTTDVPLTADEKTQITTWIDSGAPEGASTLPSSTIPTTPTSTIPTATPCPTTPGTTGDVTLDEAYAELLGEAEKQQCAARGLLFDRKTKICQEGVLLATSYQCTREGIVGKFQSLNTPGSDAVYDQYINQGFTLDQCGERNGKPVVNFYKRVPSDNEAVLQQKYICSAGDPLCPN